MTSLDTTSAQIGGYLLRGSVLALPYLSDKPGWTLLDQHCPVCFTPLLRARAPATQLLCVKCGRDTSSSSTLPNGTTPAIVGVSSDMPPPGYHPVVNGDEMDSDEEEQEAGVMVVDSTARTVTDAEQASTAPPLS